MSLWRGLTSLWPGEARDEQVIGMDELPLPHCLVSCNDGKIANDSAPVDLWCSRHRDGRRRMACWEAKYHYVFWRPVTAVPLADTDGNPATISDPSWMPDPESSELEVRVDLRKHQSGLEYLNAILRNALSEKL